MGRFLALALVAGTFAALGGVLRRRGSVGGLFGSVVGSARSAGSAGYFLGRGFGCGDGRADAGFGEAGAKLDDVLCDGADSGFLAE